MDDPRTTGTQEGEPPEASGPDDLQYQELWFSLGRRPWSSVVLVPADRSGSADEVASRLAEVGKRISRSPVTAITARSLEYGTALALADLPSFVGQRGRPPQAPWTQAVEMPPSSLDPSTQARPPEETSIQVASGGGLPAEPSGPWGEDGPMVSSGARLIISIPPVVSQPLGLATARAADLVVLCVDLGATRLADARRTLELVGRERLAGCFLIR
jgi:hypothetical protein